jgi:hypothetical protein
VYCRAAVACPTSTPSTDLVIMSVQLVQNNAVILAVNGTCGGARAVTVYFCSVEGTYADPSGSQSYQTVVDNSRVITELGASVWTIPETKTGGLS